MFFSFFFKVSFVRRKAFSSIETMKACLKNIFIPLSSESTGGKNNNIFHFGYKVLIKN